MGKYMLVLISIILVSVLIFSGCSVPTTSSTAPATTSRPSTTSPLTTSPSTTSAPSSAPASTSGQTQASAATIKLKFTDPAPPMDVFNTDVFIPWAKMINDRTTAIGKPIEIQFYFAQTLVKQPDQYKAVKTDITDISAHITVEDLVPGGGLLSVRGVASDISFS